VKPKKQTYDALYVGRLVKDKNIDIFVAAIGLAVKDKPDIKCVIIGKGTERPNIEHLIKTLKLSKNITLLDPLADANEVYAYMKSSKVFVLPSVREGFGIVALEALACDTPVITIDAPANAAKSLILNKKMGSVVPLQAESLAKEISSWSGKRTKPSLAAFVSKYDWDALADKQVKAYAA
jgi:glycosyltransferase involved in cell wall biosynthesis